MTNHPNFDRAQAILDARPAAVTTHRLSRGAAGIRQEGAAGLRGDR